MRDDESERFGLRMSSLHNAYTHIYIFPSETPDVYTRYPRNRFVPSTVDTYSVYLIQYFSRNPRFLLLYCVTVVRTITCIMHGGSVDVKAGEINRAMRFFINVL